MRLSELATRQHGVVADRPARGARIQTSCDGASGRERASGTGCTAASTPSVTGTDRVVAGWPRFLPAARSAALPSHSRRRAAASRPRPPAIAEVDHSPTGPCGGGIVTHAVTDLRAYGRRADDRGRDPVPERGANSAHPRRRASRRTSGRGGRSGAVSARFASTPSTELLGAAQGGPVRRALRALRFADPDARGQHGPGPSWNAGFSRSVALPASRALGSTPGSPSPDGSWRSTSPGLHHRLAVGNRTDTSEHAHRAAFEEDRRRDQLLAAAGWRVVRFTWRQVVREPRVVAEILRRVLLETHVRGDVAR